MNKTLSIIFLLLMQACLPPQEISDNTEKELINLDKLLKAQVAIISNSIIEKSIFLKGTEEKKEMSFDSLVLKKDLEMIFDISFPSLVQLSDYNKKKVVNEIEYQKKESASTTGLICLIIKYYEGKKIAELAVDFAESNLLYSSSQRVSLIFFNDCLVKYQISGYQKMIGMDSSIYQIRAKIIKN